MSGTENLDNFLGMDVWSALDRLVKSATVGGSKREPKPEPEREDPVMTLANDTYHFFECFTQAGFNTDQAFALTMHLLGVLQQGEE